MWLYRVLAPLTVALPASLALLAKGPRGPVLATVTIIGGVLLYWFTLPRLAHRAFRQGNIASAARRYRWLAASYLPARRRAALLSIGACYVAGQDFERAATALNKLDERTLSPSETATLLNNRAALELARGGDTTQALALAERAGELRPDVAEIAHTRATALLALDRVDEAIVILESGRGSVDKPRFEAERCMELARAWHRKGQLDYAMEYRNRAVTQWPEITIPSALA
ncbi:MAG: tetratricopeptide repeat protein [Kofleriaceae bacterium]|nr:tetratricopeptide repeat protein [Kofleriaceae bacterium]